MAYLRFFQTGVKRVFTGPHALPKIETQIYDSVQVHRTLMTYTVQASGMEPLSYQWYIDGQLQTSTTNSLPINTPTPLSVGEHTLQVKVTNPIGSIESRVATMHMFSPNDLISISRQPESIRIYQGDVPRFSVEVLSTSPIHYQWYLDHEPIPGENGPVLIGSFDTNDYIGTRILYVDVTNEVSRLRSTIVTAQVEPYEDYSTWRQDVFPPEVADTPQADPTADYNHDGITNYHTFLLGLDPGEKEGLAHRATQFLERKDQADYVRFTYSITVTRLQVYFEKSYNLDTWELAWGTVEKFTDTNRSRALDVKFPIPPEETRPLFYRPIYYFTE